MNKNILEFDCSKIEPCESIIIKDPYYDRNVWCAFQHDDCSEFTHAKGAVSNYIEHYKDEEYDFESDLNITEFALLIGSKAFISHCKIKPEKTGNLSVLSTKRLNDVCESDVTEIGCDTAQFSFGNEKTFGEFSIHTGADGSIGEVCLFTNKYSKKPLGLLFSGSCDGDIVSPKQIYDSFIAAFGVEKEKSLDNLIKDSEKQKTNAATENNKLEKDNNLDK